MAFQKHDYVKDNKILLVSFNFKDMPNRDFK